MNGKRIIVGVGLLVLAGAIAYSRYVNATIPIRLIILGCVAALLIYSGIKRRNFFLILLPAAFMSYYLFSEGLGFLGIRMFHYLGLAETMGITALVAAGLTIIFGKGNKKRINRNKYTGYVEYGNGYNNGGNGQGNPYEGNGAGTELDKNRFTQYPEKDGQVQPETRSYGRPMDDGENVVIDNGFGKLTRYLHCSNLKQVKIDNGFGYCVVYYDNVIVDENGSKLKVDNGMGQVDIYIPPFYRFKLKQNNGFGSINVFGSCNMDPAAPLIDADIKNGMGKVNIYFG